MKRTDKSLLVEKLHRGDEPHLLREIVRTYQAMMQGLSRHLGVPGSRFALLRALATSEDPVGTMELARRLGINPAAVTRQVQELESEGLVRRQLDGHDKRRQRLCLTARGMKAFKEIHARSHDLEHALLDAVSVEDVAVTTATLVRIREFIENYRERDAHGTEV